MRKLPLLFLSLLILSLFYSPLSYEAETGAPPFGETEIMPFFNWTKFWEKINTYSEWDLEYNNGSGWISDRSALQVLKNYTNHEGEPRPKFSASRCKITLNFTASYTGDHRLTFGVNLDVKNYTHEESSFNYTITYQNNTVIFDWIDLKEVPTLIFSHGVKPIGDKSYFWFRIRKNNIQQGENYLLDPSFGHYDEEITDVTCEDAITGSWATCPESGTADSISGYIHWYWGGTNLRFALYKKSDSSFVGETEEVTKVGDSDEVEWVTANFDAPKPSLENIDYWIVAWADGYCYLRKKTEADAGCQDLETYNGFPDPFNPVGLNNLHSIYCNYSAVGGLDLSYTLFENFLIWGSTSIGKELGYLFGEVIYFPGSVTATFEGIGYEYTYILSETIRFFSSPGITLEVVTPTVLTLDDVAGLAAISFIFGLIAFLLIMAKWGRDIKK